MISSRQNAHIQALKKLWGRSSVRREMGEAVLIGHRFISDFLDRGVGEVKRIYGSGSDLEVLGAKFSGPLHAVDPGLLGTVFGMGSDVCSVAVIGRSVPELEGPVADQKAVVYLDGVQDPKNLGAIARNAAAFGVELVVLGPGSADPYHPDSLRAMAGLVELVSFASVASSAELVGFLSAGFTPYFVTPMAQVSISDQVPRRPALLLLGGEAGFQSDFDEPFRVCPVRISMAPHVESLNVAVTSGLVFSWLGLTSF